MKAKAIRYSAETLNKMLNLTGNDIATAYANSGEQLDMTSSTKVTFKDSYVSMRTRIPVIVFTYRVEILADKEDFTAYITVAIDGTLHGSW